MGRVCPEHGETVSCISSGARFYWLSKGNPKNSGGGCCGGGGDVADPCCAEPCGGDSAPCCDPPSTSGSCCSAEGGRCGTLGGNANPGDAAGVMEKLATCLCLIEVVKSCNLPCPTCFASSPIGTGPRVDAVPLDDLISRISGVIGRKGKIEILQLSGGEPTLHPRFFDLLGWLQHNPAIDYVLLNTNGLRIANDPAFAERLGSSFKYGKFQLYLQFDGVGEEGQKELRGVDLRAARERCLGICRSFGIPVTLAMTVIPENLPKLWETIEYGLGWPNVRGVSFQPFFGSGRHPGQSEPPAPSAPPVRLNVADIVTGAVAQSGGKLKFEDFTPLPCGDPNCATIGYLLKVGDRVRSISDFVDFSSVQGFLGTKVRYRLEDLMKCGCESEPLGELLKQFELDETHTFRLFVKPFMDDWSWDQDRVDRCCTHVIRPDGSLDSFCRYYASAGK